MKYFKNITALILAGAALLSMSSCKKDDKKTDGSAGPTSSVAVSETPADGTAVGDGDSTGNPTDGSNGTGVESGEVSSVVVEKVDESVSDSIDLNVYDNFKYDLGEVETDNDITLIAPVLNSVSDWAKIDYHIKCVTNSDGTKTLELLGTDFVIAEDFSVIKVMWTWEGEVVVDSEKVRRFEGLCIMLDDEIYFYEDEFYSPVVEGRYVTVDFLD